MLRLVLGDDELSTWSVLLIRPHVSGDELNSSVLTPQETKDMSMLCFFSTMRAERWWSGMIQQVFFHLIPYGGDAGQTPNADYDISEITYITLHVSDRR